MNRSALISAIENENFDLLVVLLEEGIDVGDALLHAISEEYVEAVEELLQWEETHHKDGTPYVCFSFHFLLFSKFSLYYDTELGGCRSFEINIYTRYNSFDFGCTSQQL